jgi:GNAT superfamily N-acetyltransferase
MPVRHDDVDAQSYLGKRGFVEVLRMRESILDLADAAEGFHPPVGVELVAFSHELEPAVYMAALEIAQDIPAADGVEIGTIDDWRAHELPPSVLRDCSFVAISQGEVVGYATLHAGSNGEGLHAMTGVVRTWRRRGVALALKQAQIDAARRHGLHRLRTANEVDNPMLKVNERLGYERDVDWLHLRGPLLDR